MKEKNQTNALTAQIAEKRRCLRREYGGLMSLRDLQREIRMSPRDAKQWGRENQACIFIGRRMKYDTDTVAKRLVELRGMC